MDVMAFLRQRRLHTLYGGPSLKQMVVRCDEDVVLRPKRC